jgi:nucleoside-diphosphate-sugar epimerase
MLSIQTIPPINWPPRFSNIESLEDFMTEPSPMLIRDMEAMQGDVMILGVGGKMGPTLARLAKRAAPHKRVIGVARFTELGLKAKLEKQGIECIACDLLDLKSVQKLPQIENIIFMVGHKFGANNHPEMTWAVNAGVPFVVATVFSQSRMVVLSTACVYPFVDTSSAGATESVPAEPPPGIYAQTCVGREQMFLHRSKEQHTQGRLMRLSYAIDMRYGVLYDVAYAVFKGQPIDVSMGYVNVIWQGDANEQALRLLLHCTDPMSPINITGPDKTSIRWLAQSFAKLMGKTANIFGQEATSAWLVDTRLSQGLFGPPRIDLKTMMEWTTDWVINEMPILGKATHFGTRDGKY